MGRLLLLSVLCLIPLCHVHSQNSVVGRQHSSGRDAGATTFVGSQSAGALNSRRNSNRAGTNSRRNSNRAATAGGNSGYSDRKRNGNGRLRSRTRPAKTYTGYDVPFFGPRGPSDSGHLGHELFYPRAAYMSGGYQSSSGSGAGVSGRSRPYNRQRVRSGSSSTRNRGVSRKRTPRKDYFTIISKIEVWEPEVSLSAKVVDVKNSNTQRVDVKNSNVPTTITAATSLKPPQPIQSFYPEVLTSITSTGNISPDNEFVKDIISVENPSPSEVDSEGGMQYVYENDDEEEEEKEKSETVGIWEYEEEDNEEEEEKEESKIETVGVWEYEDEDEEEEEKEEESKIETVGVWEYEDEEEEKKEESKIETVGVWEYEDEDEEEEKKEESIPEGKPEYEGKWEYEDEEDEKEDEGETVGLWVYADDDDEDEGDRRRRSVNDEGKVPFPCLEEQGDPFLCYDFEYDYDNDKSSVKDVSRLKSGDSMEEESSLEMWMEGGDSKLLDGGKLNSRPSVAHDTGDERHSFVSGEKTLSPTVSENRIKRHPNQKSIEDSEERSMLFPFKNLNEISKRSTDKGMLLGDRNNNL